MSLRSTRSGGAGGGGGDAGCGCHGGPLVDEDLIALRRRFFRRASVTTIEPKFVVHPRIAEFWCTVTSPFFALPLLTLFDSHPDHLHFCDILFLVMSVGTAVSSTIYHWTLWKLFSSLDAGMAVLTAFCATVNLFAQLDYKVMSNDFFHLFILFSVAAIFVARWEKTSKLALQLTAVVTPFAMYLLAVHFDDYSTILCLFVAVTSFLLDRLRIMPTHSLWHFFGGWALFSMGRHFVGIPLHSHHVA